MDKSEKKVSELKVVELRTELSKRDADTKGLKSVLVQRLLELIKKEGNESGLIHIDCCSSPPQKLKQPVIIQQSLSEFKATEVTNNESAVEISNTDTETNGEKKRGNISVEVEEKIEGCSFKEEIIENEKNLEEGTLSGSHSCTNEVEMLKSDGLKDVCSNEGGFLDGEVNEKFLQIANSKETSKAVQFHIDDDDVETNSVFYPEAKISNKNFGDNLPDKIISDQQLFKSKIKIPKTSLSNICSEKEIKPVEKSTKDEDVYKVSEQDNQIKIMSVDIGLVKDKSQLLCEKIEDQEKISDGIVELANDRDIAFVTKLDKEKKEVVLKHDHEIDDQKINNLDSKDIDQFHDSDMVELSGGEDALDDLDYDFDNSENNASTTKTKEASSRIFLSESQKPANNNPDQPRKKSIEEDSKTLWISGVSNKTKASTLKQLFKKHGVVRSVRIVTSASKPNECFGTVRMESHKDVENAIKSLNKTEVDGSTIIVKMKPDRNKLSPDDKYVQGNSDRKIESRRSDPRRSPRKSSESNRFKSSTIEHRDVDRRGSARDVDRRARDIDRRHRDVDRRKSPRGRYNNQRVRGRDSYRGTTREVVKSQHDSAPRKVVIDPKGLGTLKINVSRDDSGLSTHLRKVSPNLKRDSVSVSNTRRREFPSSHRHLQTSRSERSPLRRPNAQYHHKRVESKDQKWIPRTRNSPTERNKYSNRESHYKGYSGSLQSSRYLRDLSPLDKYEKMLEKKRRIALEKEKINQIEEESMRLETLKKRQQAELERQKEEYEKIQMEKTKLRMRLTEESIELKRLERSSDRDRLTRREQPRNLKRPYQDYKNHEDIVRIKRTAYDDTRRDLSNQNFTKDRLISSTRLASSVYSTSKLSLPSDRHHSSIMTDSSKDVYKQHVKPHGSLSRHNSSSVKSSAAYDKDRRYPLGRHPRELADTRKIIPRASRSPSPRFPRSSVRGSVKPTASNNEINKWGSHITKKVSNLSNSRDDLRREILNSQDPQQSSKSWYEISERERNSSSSSLITRNIDSRYNLDWSSSDNRNNTSLKYASSSDKSYDNQIPISRSMHKTVGQLPSISSYGVATNQPPLMSGMTLNSLRSAPSRNEQQAAYHRSLSSHHSMSDYYRR